MTVDIKKITDEILVKDETGSFHILKKGQIEPLREDTNQESIKTLKHENNNAINPSFANPPAGEAGASDSASSVAEASTFAKASADKQEIKNEGVVGQPMNETVKLKVMESKNEPEVKEKTRPKPLPERLIIPHIVEETVAVEKEEERVNEPKKITEDKFHKASGPAAIREVVPDRVTKTDGASFYFSPEDEEEVATFRKSMQTLPKIVSNADEIAKRVVASAKLDISDDIRRRCERVIASRFRNIRDVVQTKEVLKKQIEEGGIGLSEEQVQKLVDYAEKEKIKIDAGKVSHENIKTQEHENIKSINPSFANPPADETMASTDAEDMADTSDDKQENKEPKAQEKNIVKKSDDVTSASAKKTFTRPSSRQGGVSDVKGPRRLTGPVEELKQLTLSEWKKYGDQIDVRIGKIIEKINIIAEDSLENRAKAIQAWKSSPLYKSYLLVGTEGMKEGKNMESALDELEKQGKETLKKEEFDAIADLNRTLAF